MSRIKYAVVCGVDKEDYDIKLSNGVCCKVFAFRVRDGQKATEVDPNTWSHVVWSDSELLQNTKEKAWEAYIKVLERRAEDAQRDSEFYFILLDEVVGLVEELPKEKPTKEDSEVAFEEFMQRFKKLTELPTLASITSYLSELYKLRELAQANNWFERD